MAHEVDHDDGADDDLSDIEVWPDTPEARALLTREDIARIRANREALLKNPEVQRYRAWLRQALEEGTLWGPKV